MGGARYAIPDNGHSDPLEPIVYQNRGVPLRRESATAAGARPKSQKPRRRHSVPESRLMEALIRILFSAPGDPYGELRARLQQRYAVRQARDDAEAVELADQARAAGQPY